MMDSGTVQNMWSIIPKQIVKLAHLVGFIKKICHNARSNERQIQYLILAKFSKDLLSTIML
jgi:hypothetical protein